jgi:hypothetical protein
VSVARGVGVVGLGIAILSSAALLLGWSPPARAVASAPRLEVTPALRLRFEPNRGQLDPKVRFLARGHGYGLYLGDDGATLALQRKKLGSHSALPKVEDIEQIVVSMRLVGANRVEPLALDPLRVRTNYFWGGDPRESRSIRRASRSRSKDSMKSSLVR